MKCYINIVQCMQNAFGRRSPPKFCMKGDGVLSVRKNNTITYYFFMQIF